MKAWKKFLAAALAAALVLSFGCVTAFAAEDYAFQKVNPKYKTYTGDLDSYDCVVIKRANGAVAWTYETLDSDQKSELLDYLYQQDKTLKNATSSSVVFVSGDTSFQLSDYLSNGNSADKGNGKALGREKSGPYTADVSIDPDEGTITITGGVNHIDFVSVPGISSIVDQDDSTSTATLTIKLSVTGLTELPDDYTVTVTVRDEYDNLVKTLTFSDFDEDGEATKRIKNLTVGDYNVGESSATEVSGYDLTVSGTGDVTLASGGSRVTLVNAYEAEDS